MIVSIHQPAYLPWLGYLDRIARSDVFVFLDTVQLEKNSFTNRNRIKTANGPVWLTVPVKSKGHTSKTLLDIEIDNQRNWKQKHLRSVEQAYRKAPIFCANWPRFIKLYEPEYNSLAEMCFLQLKFWLSELGIGTEIVKASAIGAIGRKSDLVVNICTSLSATTYLSGPLGRDYLDEGQFSDAGISLAYHDFIHPDYPQLHGEFLPGMGIVDYWMNSDGASVFQRGGNRP